MIATTQSNLTRAIAGWIYVTGLLAMLGLSAAYNLWSVSPLKWRLRRFDHAAIYVLIAATYTAFLMPMPDRLSGDVLGVIWITALIGIALKLMWPCRFERTSIALYLVMGWSGLAALRPIGETLPRLTLALIVIGGALYSIGVVFHLWHRLRFQNAIWHAFVLAAAGCHYAAVVTTLV